jgi:hypothetical protein
MLTCSPFSFGRARALWKEIKSNDEQKDNEYKVWEPLYDPAFEWGKEIDMYDRINAPARVQPRRR